MRRHRAETVLIAAALAFVAACGSSGKPATFRPGGPPASRSTASFGSSGSPGPGGISLPPFGRNVRVRMTGWIPASARQARAVVADKDFELAYLYSEYTGGKDRRWAGYVDGAMRRDFSLALAKHDVTTESFRGTFRFTHMRAFPDPVHKRAVDVSACYDNSRGVNTSISTGQAVPDRTPADDHYLRYTDIVARSQAGNWRVIGNYADVFYPRARECKP